MMIFEYKIKRGCRRSKSRKVGTRSAAVRDVTNNGRKVISQVAKQMYSGIAVPNTFIK
jgi:hypothetical protein